MKSRYFLTRQRFDQITNEHMSNYQFLKYSLLGMKLWSMGGTLQTAHSTSTSSLGTHSLSRGGERTLCRFTLSLKFCTFLQTSSTVHRLCEGKEELLNVSNQAFATVFNRHLTKLDELNNLFYGHATQEDGMVLSQVQKQ